MGVAGFKDLVVRPQAAAVQIAAERAAVSGDLNVRPFVLKHNLAGHPLFRLDRLARLVDQLCATYEYSSVVFSVAQTKPHAKRAWETDKGGLDPGDAVRACATSNAWVMIKHSEFDPDYDALLKEVVGELSRITGRDLLSEARHISGCIFIGSPNSVTNYHLDSETNFLFICDGAKEFHIFDGSDSSVVSEETLEEFYIGDSHAAKFRPDLEASAQVFHLQPGDMMHVPVNHPHWVQNGPAPCIALSVLIYLPENVDRAHAYQMNHLLRTIGMTPPPLGNDPATLRRRGWLPRALSDRGAAISKDAVIYSGARRLARPLRVARSIARGLSRLGLARGAGAA